MSEQKSQEHSEVLSPRERLSNLKQDENYNQLISQYGIDWLGVDDPQKRRTAKEKVWAKVDRLTRKDAEADQVEQELDQFLQREDEIIDPRQVTRQGDFTAAYDALYLSDFGADQEFNPEQKQALQQYLDSKGIDTSQQAVADRLEAHNERYKELTQGLSPSDLPSEMRRTAQRLSILENYVAVDDESRASVVSELDQLEVELEQYPDSSQELKQMKVDETVKHFYAGGVPKVLFSSDVDHSYLRAQAKSGRMIEAARAEAGIIVRDLLRNEFGVKLRFFNDTTVEGEIRTADFDEEGLRHPDFYATESMLRALLFLIEKGKEVSNFAAIWPNSETMETNRVAFEQALEEHGLIDSQDEAQEYLENIDWENLDAEERGLIKESAFSTWTGELVSKLGFDKVSDFKMNDSGLYLVLFSRENPLTQEEILA
jgi:hypothetical protein